MMIDENYNKPSILRITTYTEGRTRYFLDYIDILGLGGSKVENLTLKLCIELIGYIYESTTDNSIDLSFKELFTKNPENILSCVRNFFTSEKS